MKSPTPHVLAIGILTASLFLPEVARACATCFGDPEAPMTQGMNNAVLLLLGVVGVVQVGFVKMFWDFHKRSRALAERRKKIRLVEEE